MKKILSIALCAAAVSTFGDTEVRLGQVGVTAITSSLSNTIVAVSYDDLTGGSGIVVSNFVKTTNLTVGDQLAVFSDGKYEVWTLVQPVPPNGPKFWKKSETKFFVNGNGELTSESGTDASLVSRSVGTGIWLIRKEMPTESFTFYIYGKPATSKTIKTVPGVWNLVGNPTQKKVEITKDIIPAANNDAILVPEAKGLVTYIYKAKADNGNGAWCRAADQYGNLGPAPGIEGGKGFWIMTANAVEINWQSEGL